MMAPDARRSGYFNNALTAMHIGLPDFLTKGPDAGGLINIPAAGIILLLMGMLIIGVKQSAQLNAGMVLIKLLTITVFHICAPLLLSFG